MTSPTIPIELLDRVLSGRATPDECARVEAWARTAPDRTAALAALRAMDAPADNEGIRQLRFVVPPGPHAMAPTGPSVQSGTARRVPAAPASRHAASRRWLPLAAGIGIAAAALLAAPRLRDALESSAATTPTREYVTQRAQRANVALPDGSQVVLGPGSRLRLAADFGRARRDVELEGEAYFSVAHASSSPFTVHAAGNAVRVLGTVFTVRAYGSDALTRVAVAEGKVALGRTDAPVILLAGDVGRVRVGDTPAVSHDGRIADLFGWMHGRLTFHDEPFHDVAAELGRAYDIDIVIADAALARRQVRATVTSTSAREAIDIIADLLGAKYTWSGKRITFSLK